MNGNLWVTTATEGKEQQRNDNDEEEENGKDDQYGDHKKMKKVLGTTTFLFCPFYAINSIIWIL